MAKAIRIRIVDILLVHVPMTDGKKSHDTVLGFSKTINYGLLSISTYLKKRGKNVKILDNSDMLYRESIYDMINTIYTYRHIVIGFFCISVFAYRNLIF